MTAETDHLCSDDCICFASGCGCQHCAPITERVDRLVVDERAPAAPAPLIAGTFAIYPRPDGGLELVTDVQGRGVESRTVPAAIVKMVSSGKGPVAGLLGRMFS